MRLPSIQTGIEAKISPLRARLAKRGIKGWDYGFGAALTICLVGNAVWGIIWLLALRQTDIGYVQVARSYTNVTLCGAGLTMMVSAYYQRMTAHQMWARLPIGLMAVVIGIAFLT